MSTGVDTKANTWEPVRAPGGLLERLQCRVAFDALGESGSSFGTEPVACETESTGAEAGVVSTGADTKANTRGAAHLSEVMALPLSPSHSLVIPSAVCLPMPNLFRPQRQLWAKLPNWGGGNVNGR